ncbi:MAG: universal stress protein [Caldimonas sp.]
MLLAVDGSEDSQKAVRQVIGMHPGEGSTTKVELHLVNVQPPVSGGVSAFVDGESVQRFHKERGEAALTPARKLLDAAGWHYTVHDPVGDPATTIAALATELGCELIVMGTRGLGAGAAVLMGSVAQRTVERATVPVLLAK